MITTPNTFVATANAGLYLGCLLYTSEYTIVVVNNGPDKSFNVTVGDLLPDGVKFISSNGQYNPDTCLLYTSSSC